MLSMYSGYTTISVIQEIHKTSVQNSLLYIFLHEIIPNVCILKMMLMATYFVHCLV